MASAVFSWGAEAGKSPDSSPRRLSFAPPLLLLHSLLCESRRRLLGEGRQLRPLLRCLLSDKMTNCSTARRVRFQQRRLLSSQT